MIYSITKNVFGAYVIYGAVGIKHYYDYTKAQAKRLYLAECKRKLFYNKGV